MASWVIPCNTNKYDYKAAFEKLPILEWRQSASMEEDDIVYIYVGRPVGAILYKCIVLEVDITEPSIDDSEFIINASLQKAKKYMKLKLVEKYAEGRYDRVSLLSNGLKTIQGPSRINDELLAYLSAN